MAGVYDPFVVQFGMLLSSHRCVVFDRHVHRARVPRMCRLDALLLVLLWYIAVSSVDVFACLCIRVVATVVVANRCCICDTDSGFVCVSWSDVVFPSSMRLFIASAIVLWLDDVVRSH